MSQFTLEYLIFVFFSSLGTLQLVFSLNGIKGMLFLRNLPKFTIVSSTLFIGIIFFWFFASATRNVPDTSFGLDANDQATWFAICAFSALLFTALVTSVVNHWWGSSPPWSSQGLDVLRETTFLKATTSRLSKFLRGSTAWTRG